jgi:hypothetical protein
MIVDSEDFQLFLIDVTYDYFFANPSITENALEIMKNLAALYRYLDEHVISTHQVYRRYAFRLIQLTIRFAHLINHLACHNNSTVRNAMQAAGIFDLRDELIIRILECEPDGKLFDFLESFSFDFVSDHAHFRESNGNFHDCDM